MQDDDRGYFQARAEEERQLAAAAATVEARLAHRLLAERYQQLCQGGEERQQG